MPGRPYVAFLVGFLQEPTQPRIPPLLGPLAPSVPASPDIPELPREGTVFTIGLVCITLIVGMVFPEYSPDSASLLKCGAQDYLQPSGC